MEKTENIVLISITGQDRIEVQGIELNKCI